VVGLAKITISVPDGVVGALAGGDKSLFAGMLKEYVLSVAGQGERFRLKANNLLRVADLVMYYVEQLAGCKPEEVSFWAFATVKSARALFEMLRDVGVSEGVRVVFEVLDVELRFFEGLVERVRSGVVKGELEEALGLRVGEGLRLLAVFVAFQVLAVLVALFDGVQRFLKLPDSVVEGVKDVVSRMERVASLFEPRKSSGGL